MVVVVVQVTKKFDDDVFFTNATQIVVMND